MTGMVRTWDAALGRRLVEDEDALELEVVEDDDLTGD